MADLFTRTTTTTPNNNDIARAQWEAAQNVASRTYTPYPGTGVAPLTPAQQQAYAMITNGGLQRAGQNTLNQSITGTRAALNYTPQQVNTNYTPQQLSASYAPQQLSASYTPQQVNTNYTPQQINTNYMPQQVATDYQPQQVTAPNLGLAAQFAGAQLGPAVLADKVDPIMAASYGGAVLDPAVRAEIERLGAANLANAASVDRSAIQNVTANQGAQYMGAYQNPYESQVVQATLADLDRARQMAIVGAEDGALRSGAYGGSRHGVADSLTNEAALRQAALSAAQMRQAGFDTAANLGMTDANRMMQAALANQGVDLSAMTSNAGFQQATNLANQNAQNQYGLANAQFGNAANLANAGFANERNIAQGNLSNQAGIASMQAANAAAVANAQMQMQRNLANAQMQNQFGLSQAGFAQDAGLANMAAQNNFAITGAGLGLQASLANQNAGLQGAQLNQAGSIANANLGLQGAQLNQAGSIANQQAGLQGAQLNQAALIANQQAGLQGAQLNQAGSIANQQAGLQGAQLNQAALIANQQAGLQGANLGLNASNALAGLSNTQRANYMQNASALETVGNAQQAHNQRVADWGYQQWLRQQNYPLQQLNILNSVSGPSGGTVSQTPSLLSQAGQVINTGGSLLSLLD